jgi:uncharacterized SAM-binding protein YcdF (DUF218 family)
MFFYASKLLVYFERPSDLLLLVLIVGVVLTWLVRFRKTGILLTTVATLGFVTIAVLPVAAWVAAPLEDRFPRPVSLPSHVDGLIVLGGAVNPTVTARRGLPSLNADAERMTEFVRLAKLYPDAELVFSGGSGQLGASSSPTEAAVARLFFQQQGVDIRRVVFEDRSRNTYENVFFSKAIVKPRLGQIWLLVASAQDVPRCVGIFHNLGWSVIPIPVAYKSDPNGGDDFANNLSSLNRSTHEWLGLVVYRLTGKTDELYPSPDNP